MATEKRLIDAYELMEHLEKCIATTDRNDRAVCLCIKCFVDLMPIVDAVELPCKIGDWVWAIRSYHGKKHPQRGIVSDMYFSQDMRLQIVVKHIARGEWGKTVFATDREAYAAIGERKDND